MSDDRIVCVSDAYGERICYIRPGDGLPSNTFHPPDGNEDFGPAPVPQDQLWYRDLSDTVTNWITGLTADEISFGVVAILMLFVLARYALSSDLADDAYDVEDYIQELNDAAEGRMCEDPEMGDKYDDPEKEWSSR